MKISQSYTDNSIFAVFLSSIFAAFLSSIFAALLNSTFAAFPAYMAKICT